MTVPTSSGPAHGGGPQAAPPDRSPIEPLVDRAAARVCERLREALPRTADAIVGWMESLAPGARIPAYFLHPRAFPAVQLPWWLDRADAAGEIDMALHAELIYSTMQGYFAIRLIDDVMDGEARARASLLPACAFFHVEFMAVYRRRFPPGHRFWRAFARSWYGSADAAMADAAIAALDLAAFRAIAARKLEAARIPLIALCHARDRTVPRAWNALFRRLAQWHQLRNDFFDWHRDLQSGASTYVLSEARRRCRPGETVGAWMYREGIDWSIATLRGELAAVQRIAQRLRAFDTVVYARMQLDELARLEASLMQMKDVHGPPGPARR